MPDPEIIKAGNCTKFQTDKNTALTQLLMTKNKILNALHEISDSEIFGKLAQEKPTRGKPARRDIYFQENITAKNSEIFRPTYLKRMKIFFLVFRAKQEKSNFEIFCFLPKFSCC